MTWAGHYTWPVLVLETINGYFKIQWLFLGFFLFCFVFGTVNMCCLT